MAVSPNKVVTWLDPGLRRDDVRVLASALSDNIVSHDTVAPAKAGGQSPMKDIGEFNFTRTP